jgi:hypothetical protein
VIKYILAGLIALMAGAASANDIQFAPGTYAFLPNSDFTEYRVYVAGIGNFDSYYNSGVISVGGIFSGEGHAGCDCSGVTGGQRNPDPLQNYFIALEQLPGTGVIPPRSYYGPIDTTVVAQVVPPNGAYCPLLIVFEDELTRDLFAFDCEYFEPDPVPEPSLATGLMAGLFAICGLASRKKKAPFQHHR